MNWVKQWKVPIIAFVVSFVASAIFFHYFYAHLGLVRLVR